MPKYKGNLNAVYISERMRHSLQPVARSSLTAVVAPMGYGKTTAINWYLNERGREGAAVLRVSIYSANRAIFWKSLQKAFAQAGLTVLEGYECPTDASGAALLLDDLCTALAGERETYLFLDDFHLLRDEQAAAFLCALANRLPGNAHLVVASRNDFLPQGEILRLGQRLHRVGADQLRLALTRQNAFVTRLPDGESFRFHHMMKECAERLFAQLPAPRQAAVWERYGRWYEARRAQLNGSADRPAIAAALTEKELALARLVAQRRTNKEIAETLHLSEGPSSSTSTSCCRQAPPCRRTAPSWPSCSGTLQAARSLPHCPPLRT